MTKKVKITCALCRSDITCNYENLYEHATSKHKMGLKELYEKIMEITNNGGGGEGGSGEGGNGGSIDYQSNAQTQNNNSFGASEYMPFPPAKNRYRPILPKPPGHQNQGSGKPYMTITEWKNQCEFQCLECNKIFRDASTAQKHVFERHNLDTKTYKAKHGLSKMMTKEKTYNCFICGQQVQWAYGSMFQHSRTHNMTMQEMYEKEFGFAANDQAAAMQQWQRQRQQQQQQQQEGASDFPEEWEGEQAAEGLVYTDNAEEESGGEDVQDEQHYALNEESDHGNMMEQHGEEEEEQEYEGGGGGEEEQIQTTAADVKNFMQLWGGLLAQNESHNNE